MELSGKRQFVRWLLPLLFMGLGISACNPAPTEDPQPKQNKNSSLFQRFETFQLGRDDLGKDIGGHPVRVEVWTVGSGRSHDVQCLVLWNRTLDEFLNLTHVSDMYKAQVRPDFYVWKVFDENRKLERLWRAHFYPDGQGYYWTAVSLPFSDYARSKLYLYFTDFEDDGKQDNVEFVIDMSEFDWSPTGSQRRQARDVTLE
jgi:hypothetical protein